MGSSMPNDAELTKVTPSANTVAANTALAVSGGALVGAAVGTFFLPGIGSAIGAVVGSLGGVAGERWLDRSKTVIAQKQH